MATLVELLQWQARERPNCLAFRFLAEGETEAETLTFAELDRRARAVASMLGSDVAPGTRACLFFPPGLDYITALFGTLYAGLIAVPAYPPRSKNRLERLEILMDDPAQMIALSTRKVMERWRSSLASAPQRLKDLRWLTIEEGVEVDGNDWHRPQASGDAVAIIQYTSGSTTNPRGVMLSHRNLLENLEQIRLRFGATNADKGVIWLPPYHDMGLIGGILQPIYGGFECTLMSPGAFLQRPVRWLEAISRYGGTISGGPDFAYDLCVRKIALAQRRELDLRTWTTAFNGAEPVRWETVERFTEAFASCGFRREAFRPCYGLAEGTLMVSSGTLLQPIVVDHVDAELLGHNRVVAASGKKSRTLVGCGPVVDDTEVRIVDPQNLADATSGSVGEIWVSGPSVAIGYFNAPEDTEQTFGAELDGKRFLRTGDLGYFRDQELFVAGRIKDLIIVRGANHYAHDIEAALRSANPAAAFGVPGLDGERLVIVMEMDRRKDRSPQQMADDARTAVGEACGIEIHELVFVKPGGIPRTSSGKMRRGACRTAYLEGALDVVSRSLGNTQSQTARRSESEIRNWLTHALSGRVGLPAGQIDTHLPFTDHGLESADAVSLALELETWLGRPAAPMLIWDYPSIDALAAHLSSDATIPYGSQTGRVDEPIAIIGIGCRFPDAPDPDSFWNLLEEGRTAVSETPSERWLPSAETGAGARWGAFLKGIDQFDPYFFGIAPREAANMDPQQRLLLEVAWEALENAGQAPTRLAGTRTGVFVGISSSDYAREQTRQNQAATLDLYSGTGNALSIAANRISYTLDLKGPSLSVDTACSSSLVAVHLAVESLRRGESSLAIAGGVNLMISPETSSVFSRARMLAPDGRCKVFDAAADGYVRGEGCGVVILKRLSEALSNGDRIDALILASGVNQDGRTNGLTAPNGPSQRALVMQTLTQAHAAASEVGYVEAHGTGTPLGDPIEVQSLAETFVADSGGPCWLGSVKANIGHLEPAAGIASVIKTVLAMRHEAVPPQVHLENLNSHIPLAQSRLQIPRELSAWPRGPHRRLALVNSFGFGGTNATALLAEAPVIEHVRPQADNARHLFTLSARTESALRTLAVRYADFLDGAPVDLADLCFTANTGRAVFSCRLAAIVSTMQELARHLRDFTGLQTARVDGTPRGDAIVPSPTHLRPSLEDLRDLFLAGFEIDWVAFASDGDHVRLALPTYPFERERFWLEKAAPVTMQREVQLRPLLARRLDAAAPVFEMPLSLESAPWLASHRIRGEVVFPAAAYLEMVLEAGMEEFGEISFELRDIVFERALVLMPGIQAALQLVLTPQTDTRAIFQIFSRSGGAGNWTSHCRGTIHTIVPEPCGTCPETSGVALDVEQVYRDFANAGIEYGETFRNLRKVWRGRDGATARVELRRELSVVAGDFAIHPALLDACLHVLGSALEGRGRGSGMPLGMESFAWYGEFATAGIVSGHFDENSRADVQMWSDDGQPIFRMTGLRIDAGESAEVVEDAPAPALAYYLRWQLKEPGVERTALSGHYFIVPDSEGLAGELQQLIRDAGAGCDIQGSGSLEIPANATAVICLSSIGREDSETVVLQSIGVIRSVIGSQRSLVLYLVTEGAHSSSPAQAGVVGLGRVLALEHPGIGCTLIDVERHRAAAQVLAELSARDGESQVAYEAGHRMVARIVAAEATPSAVPSSESYRLTARGSLQSLSVVPAARLAPGSEEVEVRVSAAGMNFSDVMKAMELYPGAGPDPILGAEFAGIVERVGEAVSGLVVGDAVMGIAPCCFAPFVTTHTSLVVRIPSPLRMEEAAAIPVAFLTAAYSLTHLARIRKGESILIHAASGGVGLAALQIARQKELKVYATAGSAEKRAYLESLGCTAVFDSRSLDFVEGVRAATKGRGVDVVLNSLAGEAMVRSLDLVAPHGRFIEIGKSDIYQNRPVGLAPFQRAISYFAVDLDRMFRERRDEVRELLAEVAGECEKGEWRPLPLRVFELHEAQHAFRHMAQARHIGKIVLTPPPPAAALLNSDASYLITGGLGALGLQVAEWMATAGARHIVLMGRSRPTLAAEAVVASLRDQGIHVTIQAVDVADRNQLREALAAVHPPLRGVVHAAGVLADATIANLPPDHVHTVLQPKIAGGSNLHELTRDLPLDFFVLFSSLAAVLGSPGQGSYAAANAYLDALARYRRSQGLPALSINWGPWQGTGMAAGVRFADGVDPLEAGAALRTMESLLQHGDTQAIVASVDWGRLTARMGNHVPPLLSELRVTAARPAGGPEDTLRENLMAATPEERRTCLESHILEHVGRVSGIPIDRLDLRQSLGDMGIDSLTALELTSSLEQTLHLSLPLTLLNGNISVADLAAHIADRLMA